MTRQPVTASVRKALRARPDHASGTRPTIGSVQLGKIPRVVLATGQDSPALRAAVRHGVDILEFRVDQLGTDKPAAAVALAKSIRRHGLPLIGTVRSAREGGASKTLPDTRRAALYAAVSPFVDAVDVEIRSARALAEALRVARANGNVVILSYHNFSKTPALAELIEIADRAADLGADIIKIAAEARIADDLLRVFHFTEQQRSRNLVTIAMGAMGSVSRLLLPLAGSLLTYTNLTPALGQIPLDRLIDDLRFYYPAYDADITKRLHRSRRSAPGRRPSGERRRIHPI